MQIFNTFKRKEKESKDELTGILKQLKNNPIVKSRVFKQHSYCKFVSLLRVINYLEIFCSKSENSLVIAVDIKYNLCNIWITYTSYRNQGEVRTNNRKHPGFLGLLFFFFAKDIVAFSRLSIEIMLHGIKKYITKFRVKLDEAICQGWRKYLQVAGLFTVLYIDDKKKNPSMLLKNIRQNLGFSKIYMGRREAESMNMTWLNLKIRVIS